ncbi:MAG: hypothetical protein QM503_01610 [Bacteroidota bacterium]
MVQSQQNTGIFGSMSEVKLNELRKMIVGLDTEDLRRLSIFVNDPEAFSEEISGLLPNSIKLMLDKGNISYSVLIPVVESALKDSIKKNPKVLADVLFPIMMPAIRKAVAEDISNMLESLNSTLENRFSPKRLGWRLKSIFSSTSYAEIVLSNAYIFRVRQVFLIHKQSGLLLGEASNKQDNVTKDSDMVSSMLSAIKDFVQDSFDVEQKNELDSIKVGQFNIWIEQGPGAIIAAIVEGNAPSEFRTNLKESIEKVHLKQSHELENFEGDTDIFKKSEPYLQDCVVSEQKEKKKKKPVILILLAVILFGAGCYWAYLTFDQYIRINKLEIALKAEPGIVITDNDKINGKIIYEGLRDPLAANPLKLLNIYNVDTSEVAFAFKPFISLEYNLILKRAHSILMPPNTVELSLTNHVLFASGKADKIWVDMALSDYVKIVGVNSFDITSLKFLSVKLHVESKKLLIENYYFVFKYNAVKLDEKQEVKFDNLITEVNTLLNFDFDQDSVPVIVVIAHTSHNGNAIANKRVAFERAQQFINLMAAAGIPIEVLVPKTDFIEEIDEEFPVRSVSFKITYSKPEEL